MFKILNLRADDLSTPLGIDAPTPRLSWHYETDAPLCECPEVRVAAASAASLLGEPDLWDSNWQRPVSPALRYDGPTPKATQRVYWQVRVRVGDAVYTSQPSWFEAGLLAPADWHGYWIAAAEGEESPKLTRQFTLAAAPRRARAYMCGLGFFELSVNGLHVGDELLQPVWTAFSAQKMTNMLYPYHYGGTYRVPYRTFDLTEYLRPGENRIEVWLGNGWYHQNVRNVEGDLWYGDGPKLLAELRIDGLILATDETWQWTESPLVENNLFRGEVYDARRKSTVLHYVRLVDAPLGALRAQICPSDAVHRWYCPFASRMDADEPSTLIIDFAQNLSGWVSVDARENRSGDQLTIRFAEEVEEAGQSWRLDYASSGGDQQIQRDVLILAGEPIRYHPRFTWHGFRFASFTLTRDGMPVSLRLQGGHLVGAEFTAEIRAAFVSVNHQVTARFQTSNDDINWFHHAFLDAMRSNQHCGVPLDCPHRERLGYTGDGQVTAEAILLNADAMPFYRKWLEDILDAQHRETGHVPHTAPFYNGGGGPGGWGGAVALLPWTMYRYSGDEAVLSRAYPAVVRFLNYLHTRSERGLVVCEEEGGWCLGEWCAPGEIVVPPELVNTYFHILLCDQAAKMARVLGDAAGADRWNAKVETLRAAFHDAFFDERQACYSVGYQGADAFALHCGAVPKPLRQQVFEGLCTRLSEGGWRFDTGMFGTPVLLAVLSDYGRSQEAFQLMAATEPPSFTGSMRARGATTLYEHWHGGSHNHVMFGAPDSWLFAYACGLSQSEESVGWAHITLRPGWIRALDHAEATIQTPRGPASIKWTREPGALRITAIIPPTASATLLPPSGCVDTAQRHLTAGRYQLMLEAH